MQEILKTLKEFLKQNYEAGRPILLAYSGGFDSKALLYALLEVKNQFSLDLHLAHVNHNWRSESSLEAKDLAKEAKSLGLPFHLHELSFSETSNLEEKCRELRFLFFQDLFKKYQFQALLLAHQSDDVSETVLKRFLEGADFFSLKAMEEVSFQRNMAIWRPLLRFTKKELQLFLKEKKLSAIDDPTNKDPKYQRSNMRANIIPSLASKFGKEISKNLFLASKRSSEIYSYLSKNTGKYFDMKKEGPFGLYLDFTRFLEIDELEKKFLIKRLGNYLKIDLSRSIIERIIKFLGAYFTLKINGCKIITYKNILFFLTKEPFFHKTVALKEGKTIFDMWEIEVLKTASKDTQLSSWEDLWRGESTIYLPVGNYSLVPPTAGINYLNKRLNKWFSESKVPLFLRFCFPVIFKDDKMIYEFLSGKKRVKELKTEYYKISFKLSCLN